MNEKMQSLLELTSIIKSCEEIIAVKKHAVMQQLLDDPEYMDMIERVKNLEPEVEKLKQEIIVDTKESGIVGKTQLVWGDVTTTRKMSLVIKDETALLQEIKEKGIDTSEIINKPTLSKTKISKILEEGEKFENAFMEESVSITVKESK